jgi:hypothetical protein
MVHDWTSHHVIFTGAPEHEKREVVLNDPRFWNHFYFRGWRPNWPFRPQWPVFLQSKRDWSYSLNNGSGGTIGAPAKFVFDVTATPSCTKDFIVTGVNVAGSTTQANIIGLTNLYVDSSGKGYCSGTAPTLMFAYNIGTGLVNSYISLSLAGDKVAFNENGTTPYFHVLTFSTGTGNGTSAAAPAVPGTGNSAVDTKLALTGGVSTAPYVDYAKDTAYVTTTDNVMHKFSGVFRGTPAEVTTGGWPISTGISTSYGISTPVYDGVTKHVFFTDSSNGSIDYVDDSGSTATVVTGTFDFGSAGFTPAPVVVDSTNQKVYAFAANPNGTHAVVAQADTSLSSSSQVVVNVGNGNTAGYNPLEGDFNNAYYSGTAASALLYVVGNDSTANRIPSLFGIGFNSSFKMNATASSGPIKLATATAGASPVTEFYNSTTSKDYIFVGVTTRCTTAITGGCIRSIDITSGFPTATSVNNVVLAASGGTGGITVDNNSSYSEASSVYYAPLSGNTVVKATQSALQ